MKRHQNFKIIGLMVAFSIHAHGAQRSRPYPFIRVRGGLSSADVDLWSRSILRPEQPQPVPLVAEAGAPALPETQQPVIRSTEPVTVQEAQVKEQPTNVQQSTVSPTVQVSTIKKESMPAASGPEDVELQRVLAESERGPYDGREYIPLPTSVEKAFPTLIQLPAEYQHDNITCAYHAIQNGTAISNLVTTGTPITNTALNRERNLAPITPLSGVQGNLSSEQIAEVIINNNLTGSENNDRTDLPGMYIVEQQGLLEGDLNAFITFPTGNDLPNEEAAFLPQRINPAAGQRSPLLPMVEKLHKRKYPALNFIVRKTLPLDRNTLQFLANLRRFEADPNIKNKGYNVFLKTGSVEEQKMKRGYDAVLKRSAGNAHWVLFAALPANDHRSLRYIYVDSKQAPLNEDNAVLPIIDELVQRLDADWKDVSNR